MSIVPTPGLAAILPSSLALVAGIVSLTVVIIVAWRTTRIGLRTWKTVNVARALTDTHLDALDRRIARATAHLDPIADHNEELAAALAALQDDVTVLRALLTSIPHERARFKQRMKDLVRAEFAGKANA